MKPAPVDLQGKHDSRNLASLIAGQDHSTLQILSFSVKEINISSLFLVHIETAESFAQVCISRWYVCPIMSMIIEFSPQRWVA
jgi:hypothetical protein